MFSNPLDGFRQGYNAVETLVQDRARRQAGQSMASGDLVGASQTLARAGNLDGAFSLQQANQRQKEQEVAAQRAAEALQRRRQVGGLLADGDFRGASAEAFRAGDLDLGGQIQSMRSTMNEAQRKEAADRAEWMARAAQALDQAPAEQYDGVFATLEPTLRAMGLPQAQIEQFRQDGRDPAKRQAFIAQAMTVVEALQEADRKADNAREDRKADAQIRQGEARIGIAQGQLGLSRERHAATLAGQGGYAFGAGFGQMGQFQGWEEF